MRLCSKCGKEINFGMPITESGLCNECCFKAEFYEPDITYPEKKKFKRKTFNLSVSAEATSINSYELIGQFINFEIAIREEIKKEAIQANKFMAVIFNEYNINEKMKEICEKGTIDLEMSYFFTNDKFMTVPNYEDRKKDKKVIFTCD